MVGHITGSAEKCFEWVAFSCVVMLCSDVIGYQHHGGPCCLHCQGVCGITTQKTMTWMSISKKTSNLACFEQFLRSSDQENFAECLRNAYKCYCSGLPACFDLVKNQVTSLSVGQ